MKRLRLRALVLATALLASAAACGDDEADSTEARTEETSTDASDSAPSESSTAAPSDDESAATADAGPADGESLRIGFINQEEGSGSTFPDLREGAEAARDYVNANGGINGRPLEFVDCTTNGSPESSQACANEMIEAGVPIIDGGIDYGSPSSIPILGSAGVIYVPTLPTIAEEYGSPGV